MKIQSEFETKEIPNSLKLLNEELIIQVIQLSCASNDLITNLNASGKFPEDENAYFFYNSICILREIAKQIKNISENTKLPEYFSSDTSEEFKILKLFLEPFDEESLSKSVLKPIRDAHFHYKFKSSDTKKTDNQVKKLLNPKTLKIGVIPNDPKLSSIRYTFAETFRSDFINNHLDKNITKELSKVVVSLVAFIDLLLVDLEKLNNKKTHKKTHKNP